MQTKIKTQEQIDAMRKAGKVLGEVLYELKTFIKPGVNGEQIDEFAEQYIIDHGMIPGFKGYHGFPATICLCINHEVVHGIPDKKTIVKDGDIVTVDCGVIYKKMNTDAAFTYAMPGVEESTIQFLKVCQKALYNGIKEMRPGNRIGDVSNSVEKTVKAGGYKIVKDLVGHGIGEYLHEEPHVPNYGKRGTGLAFKPGHTFAIEPIVGISNGKVKTLNDGWMIVTEDATLSCQFEHTVLISPSGYEILTLQPGETVR